jgi:hypothetical protein
VEHSPQDLHLKATLSHKKKLKTAADIIDEQYQLELKRIGGRTEMENNSDHIFLLSLLPAMKHLSPMDNPDFRMEVQRNFIRKLFPAQCNVWETDHHFDISVPASHSSASTSAAFSDHN